MKKQNLKLGFYRSSRGVNSSVSAILSSSLKNIAFGSSMKSEREAYDRAMDLLSSIGVEMDTIRLVSYQDRHGSYSWIS